MLVDELDDEFWLRRSVENNFFELFFGNGLGVCGLRGHMSSILDRTKLFPSYFDTLHVRVYFGTNKHTK